MLINEVNKVNIENFKKIKEKLEQQKKENSTKISLYDERIRMSRVNSFHNNVQCSLAYSLIAYLPALFISFPHQEFGFQWRFMHF